MTKDFIIDSSRSIQLRFITQTITKMFIFTYDRLNTENIASKSRETRAERRVKTRPLGGVKFVQNSRLDK